jgi:hypothetical protein
MKKNYLLKPEQHEEFRTSSLVDESWLASRKPEG